jgi:hypothetical protein
MQEHRRSQIIHKLTFFHVRLLEHGALRQNASAGAKAAPKWIDASGGWRARRVCPVAHLPEQKKMPRIQALRPAVGRLGLA